MPALTEIILDETTYYSILGLSSSATEAEVHKSYMILARQLHPDKSKSEASAEQFKLISHAHSVLMDEAKKVRYDRSLRSKGLHEYVPGKNYHRHTTTGKKTEINTAKQAPRTPQKEFENHRRPYEQQPYGFGTEGLKTSHTHSKVPIFQSFNLKNYQRSQKSSQAEERELPRHPDKRNGFAQQFEDTKSHNNSKESKSKDSDDLTQHEHDSRKKHDEPSDIAGNLSEAPAGHGMENPLRSKMHKANLSDPFDAAPRSPFENNQDRHYARKKHEARLQGKRSTSPVKTTPTSKSPVTSDTWDGLKDLLNKFEKKESSTSHNTEDQKSGSVGPTEKWHEKNSSGKVRKSSERSLHLDDLNNSLPLNEKFFDMQGVSDTLDDVPVIKRAKKDDGREHSPEVEMISPAKQYHPQLHTQHPIYLPQPTETLHMPVNQPLPKFYKSDLIALDQYKVNSQLTNWELPAIPNFQCNFLNKSEVAHCKQLVMEFNARCNSLKQKLLVTMYDRLDADRKLDERLVKIENTANWVSCKDFDYEVVNKLSELQNRQRIVAQSFASILKSMYAAEY